MADTLRFLREKLQNNLTLFRASPRRWFVLSGNRILVAGLLSSLFTLVVVALMAAEIIVIANTSQMVYLAQALITGNVTLVTIVLAINQLVLSREFGTPGQLADKIENVIEYRQQVAETVDSDVLPAMPTDFFVVVVDGSRSNAQRFGGIVEGHDNDQLREEAKTLVSAITADTDDVSRILSQAEQDVYNTLAASLETNFSQSLNEARRFQHRYDEALSAAAHEVLDELIDALFQVDIARQYLKSIYIQSELVQLSRLLLYVGLPAVGGGILMLLIYVDGLNGAVAPNYLQLFVLFEVVLSFSLVTILFSFVLRTATVAQRTVAVTPFATPSSEITLGRSNDEASGRRRS